MTSEDRFDREVWRDTVTESVLKATGYEPYGWQLEVGEALHLGLDCLVLAGTGTGKITTFIMNLLATKKKERMVWIFSSLRELQFDQVNDFFHCCACSFALRSNALRRWVSKLSLSTKIRTARML